MQQINNVHVKIQCDNDFRRFVLAEVTYTKLAETICSLLRFAPNSSFKLSYLDDENDWVLFTTDSELQYAVTISKSPLKISVKLSDKPVIAAATLPHCPFKFTAPVDQDGASMEDKPWKWRGGRGGRGCKGGRRGECGNKVERVNAKLAHLNDRHAVLTAKLIESDLPQEKVRAIEWRLSHIQNKIDALQAKKEHIAACAKQNAHQEAPVEKTENDETPKDEDPRDEDAVTSHPHPRCHRDRDSWGHGRWGGRGPHCRRFGGEHSGEGHPHHPAFGGEHPHPPFPHGPPPHLFGGHPHHGPRGGCKRAERGDCGGKGPKAFALACSTPEGKAAFDRVHAAKDAVMAARREKAEREAVIPKLEELKEAKAAWRVIKVAMWIERKEQQRAAGCPRKQAK